MDNPMTTHGVSDPTHPAKTPIDQAYSRSTQWDELSDSDLLVKLQDDDPEAMAVFVQRYGPIIFRIARLHFCDHQQTAEFTEETLADLIRRIRKQQLPVTTPIEIIPIVTSILQTIPTIRAGEGISKKQHRLLVLLSKLPPEQRLIVEYSLLMQLPDPIVSHRLGIPIPAIRDTCHAILRITHPHEHSKEVKSHEPIATIKPFQRQPPKPPTTDSQRFRPARPLSTAQSPKTQQTRPTSEKSTSTPNRSRQSFSGNPGSRSGPRDAPERKKYPGRPNRTHKP